MRDNRRFYIASLVVFDLVLAVGWLLRAGLPDPVPVLVLALMAFAAERFRIGVEVSADVSLTAVLLLTSAALADPAGAAVVAGVAFAFTRGEQPWSARIFNIAMACALGEGGAWTYYLVGGWQSPHTWDRGTVATGLLVPLLAAAVVMYLINAVLVATMVHVSNEARTSWRVTTQGLLDASWRTYALSAGSAFLFVTLWVGAGLEWLSAFLMTAPLVLVQWAVQEEAASRLALRPLVQTIARMQEKFDPAYADRAQLAVREVRARGSQARLSARDLRQLEYAAAIAWVGRIAADHRPIGQAQQRDRIEQLLGGIPTMAPVLSLLTAGDQADAPLDERHHILTQAIRDAESSP